MKAVFQTLILLSILIVNAQKSDDSNIVYKNKNGEIMTKEAVEKLFKSGPVNMKTISKENGEKEVTLSRTDIEEQKKLLKSRNETIKKLYYTVFPDFDLVTTAGLRLNQRNLKGKITVVNFWFTTCGPCVKEIPSLNYLMQKYKDEPIEFLAFTFNKNNEVRKFLKENDFSYKQLPDARKIIKELKITIYPTHMVLDKNGIIQEVILGWKEDVDKKNTATIEHIKKEH
ncbi:TlpA disulfide reductase family protein [Aquimarina gracilis]|uniref:TlpA disulfide reductase family protein n=1 Tax=Aquimarina gracilis TaxID=874422 RepID=A0ABU5ZQV7_9FLAO|nr:TlpA disulfide reductase family protein [Aquimarina gracilis]MEB3344303.1 TlpA disulfide reductase family protein [Aquimarina gracilis]